MKPSDLEKFYDDLVCRLEEMEAGFNDPYCFDRVQYIESQVARQILLWIRNYK